MKFTRLFVIIILFISFSVSAESRYYEVAKNDTLWSISRQFNVSIEDLKAANNITDERSLIVGTRLLVPTVYRVKKGDTLWGIARAHQTSVQVLRELNSLTADSLDIGDVLIVPAIKDVVVPDSTMEVADAGVTETVARNVADNTVTNVAGTVPFWPHTGSRTRREGKLSGTEFSGKLGDPVITIASGEVVWQAENNLVYGNLIIIESADRHLYLYAGLADTMVSVGQQVKAGTKIAELGVDSLTGEAKLLLSVYKNGRLIDPSTAPRG